MISRAMGLFVVVVLTVAATRTTGSDSTSSADSGSPSQTSPAAPDVDAIEAVARDYIEGWYTGNVQRMARAIHVDLVKRMPVGDDSAGGNGLRPVSRARMLELTGEGGGEDPNAVVEIFVDDVSTDIATARVLSPEYLDYLHLARTSEGWKIVNVLFHVRD